MQPVAVLAALAAIVAVASLAHAIPEPEVQRTWEGFKVAHGKTYPTALDEAFRRKIFKENLIAIAKHNALFDEGVVSFKLAVNQYSDLLPYEVHEKLNGLRPKRVEVAAGHGLPAIKGVRPDDKRDNPAVRPIRVRRSTAGTASPSELEVQQSWMDFKVTYAKVYPTDQEETYRRKIFKENLISIARHNALFDEGLVSFKLSVNEFSDLLSFEAAEFNGLRPGHKHHGVDDNSSPVHPTELEVERSWNDFKVVHGKAYPTELDETFRRKIFTENVIAIAKHNALFDEGLVSFKLGVNQYTDLLLHEVAEKLDGLRPGLKPSKAAAGHGLPALAGRPSGELGVQQHWQSFKRHQIAAGHGLPDLAGRVDSRLEDVFAKSRQSQPAV